MAAGPSPPTCGAKASPWDSNSLDPARIFLAGIGNSGSGHWQARWHAKLPGSLWVEHADWQHPDLDAWLSDFETALTQVKGPKLVIAHSLGCLVFSEWATAHSDQPSSALLVAVPDLTAAVFPKEATGFRSAFDNRLDGQAIMVASHNDPYASIDYSRRLAELWRVKLVDVGNKGHINADSNLDDWSEGWRLLQELTSTG